MFQDESAPFLDDVLKLGHYLGPKIDVSPAITTKILFESGQVFHRSTYRPLTPDELLDNDRTDAQEQFIARVCEKLVSWVLPRELEDIRLECTPQYDPYEDEGKPHLNPILDTRMYQVEFAGDKVTELTTNVFFQSMYIHCNADGNECLLLDTIVDYCKDNKVSSLAEQQTSILGRPVTHKTTAAGKFGASRKTVLPHGRSCPN